MAEVGVKGLTLCGCTGQRCYLYDEDPGEHYLYEYPGDDDGDDRVASARRHSHWLQQYPSFITDIQPQTHHQVF